MDEAKTFEVKLDAGGIIVGFNAYASELSGYSRKEVLGRNWFEIFIEEDDLLQVLKLFQDIFLGKNLRWDNTNQILAKSGERLTIHWKNEIIMDENGKRLYVLAKGKLDA